MFTPPDDLSDVAVADAFGRGWGIEVEAIEYAAVGFGSHHWRASTGSGRWFLTVDDLDLRLVDRTEPRSVARHRLEAALSTARSLRCNGYEFVVAPVPSLVDRIVEPVDDRFVLAAYPHVEGVAGSFGRFGNRADRFAVVDPLVRLHRVDVAVPANTDSLVIPAKDRLDEAMLGSSRPWSTGPFAEPARDLLRRRRAPLQRALAAHDTLIGRVRWTAAVPVVSHGEPHPGNVIVTTDGPVLVDWDTALMAPPERDLWRLVDEDPEVRHHYEQATGRTLDDDTLRAYSLWWDLCEVSLFVDDSADPGRPRTPGPPGRAYVITSTPPAGRT